MPEDKIRRVTLLSLLGALITDVVVGVFLYEQRVSLLWSVIVSVALTVPTGGGTGFVVRTLRCSLARASESASEIGSML
jgi:nitrate/nitrite transporter NarK